MCEDVFKVRMDQTFKIAHSVVSIWSCLPRQTTSSNKILSGELIACMYCSDIECFGDNAVTIGVDFREGVTDTVSFEETGLKILYSE